MQICFSSVFRTALQSRAVFLVLLSSVVLNFAAWAETITVFTNITVLHTRQLQWPAKLAYVGVQGRQVLYRGADVNNRAATMLVSFGPGNEVRMDMHIAENGFRGGFTGTWKGNVIEGEYQPSAGFGPRAYFRGDTSGTTQVDFADPATEIQASVLCDKNPLVMEISALPSEICTVWIRGWRRNTADPVQLVAVEALDAYGNHRNGIQVFGVTPGGSSMGMAPATMSGFRGPDGSYGTAYPWKIQVFACPGQSGTGANCLGYRAAAGPFRVPLEVRQKGARTANVALTGNAVARNRGGEATGGAVQGQGGAQGGGGEPLQGQIVCTTQPLRVRISGLPSQTCTVWISGWRRNTADRVEVVLPEARDGYGNHANGIQVFGAVRPGEPGMGVDPGNMSGFRAPDGSYGTSYPWNLQVFGCPGQQGAGVNCFSYRATPGPFSVPIVIRQRGAADRTLFLTGTAFAGRDDAFSTGGRPQWTPPQPVGQAAGGGVGQAPGGGAVVPARPVAVAVQTARGTQNVAAGAGPVAIVLSPDARLANLVARCHLMAETVLAIAADVSREDRGGSGTTGRSMATLLAIVGAACRQALDLPPETGLRREAGAGRGEDERAVTEVSLELQDGAARFEVPLETVVVNVRTPAGTVRSAGRAGFSASYSRETGRMSLVPHTGNVQFTPAGSGMEGGGGVSGGTTTGLTAERLVNRRFQFGWRTVRGAGVNGVATLQADGSIAGIASANEANWRMDERGGLLFLSRDGRITTRFDQVEVRDGQLSLSGEFLLNAEVRHTLLEIPGEGGCGLGRSWRDNDPAWPGTWIRRGQSNVFDASWTGGRMRVDAQMVIVVEGNRVSITRTGFNTVSDGEIADYTGVIGSDGVTVSGTYQWRNTRLGSGRWQATIACP